jgi:site-specific recombinase XerD
MKRIITIKRLFHHNEWRYGIYFDFDRNLSGIAKSITGSIWSQTNKCWHVPAEESVLKKILKAYRDVADIDISSIALPSAIKKSNETTHDELPEDFPDNSCSQVFVPPPSSGEVGKVAVIARKADGSGRYDPVSFSINEPDGRLIIRFLGRYDQEWVSELRSYRQVKYDNIRREWSLRWSQLTVDSLSDYFASKGINVIVKKPEPSKIIREIREDTGSGVRGRVLREEAEKGIEDVRRYLSERRYSVHTLNSYISHLEFFFKYFDQKDPGEISDKDIEGFMHDFIIANNYSASYQNQVISAVKIFYGHRGGRDINSSVFERPRRSRSLPKVFSKEEIMQIFNATKNGKHKLILWMVYSCGLRRSEVINIRLPDLDTARGTLHIREGKGNVDRMVPISPKIWEKIRSYIKSYKPSEYLFEGQSGGKYSVESVYNVFKKSLRNSGIKKDVGIHSLRHSYATHLHEGGLDIRFIQELLGHKSTRTTEIYTHVSRRDLLSIRSPIDDMEIE